MLQQNSVVGVYSPPFRVVSKYFIASILSFVFLNFMILLHNNSINGYHFQPKILSINHIATLGFITMIIFGAMFQLVPVVLEVKLFSSALAEIQFWIYLIGVILLVYKFWNFDSSLSFIVPALMLSFSIIIFSINIILSMINVKNWNITGTYLASAIFWLLITALAGYLLSKNLDKPFIKINHLQYLNLHAITAYAGWVGMVIMGVSFKLFPMFTLSHGYKMILAKISFVLTNLGLLGINWIMHYPDTKFYNVLFGSLIYFGFILYIIQIYIVFKNRIRKKLDIGLKFSVVALIMMGFVSSMNFSFLFFNYELITNLTLVYGILVTIGTFGMLIVGQMYKIVPFLVWYHKYSSKAGLENVPLLKDMFNEKIAEYQMFLMISGIILSSMGLLIQMYFIVFWGSLLLFLSSLIFAFNMYKIYKS